MPNNKPKQRTNQKTEDKTGKVPIAFTEDTSTTKVTQIGNRISGNNAGRDIVTLNTYNYSTRSQIAYLNERYKEECDNNTEVCQYIRELLHYTERSDEEIKGLDYKLKLVNRDDDFIQFATKQKELFAKRLLKRDLSPAAQKIFAYIMGKIKLSFMHNIVPKIKSGISEQEIDRIIYSVVIEPIFNELEENVLDLTMDEIHGMLFYLTGNCHIYWNKLC